MKKLLKKALQGLSLEQQKLLQPYLNPDLTGFQNSFAFPNTFQNNNQSPSYPTSQTPIVSDNPMDNQQQDSYTTKRTFGFNPGMYGALYGANTALTGISNNVENAYQKQNIIQNRLNPLPQVGSRSNSDKYGYGFGASFGKGGKTSPYKMGNVPNPINFNGLATTEYNEPNMSPITLDNMTILLQLVDPTGMFSYPDIYNSKTPEQRAVAMASAIPAFGKLANLAKGTKQASKIINLMQNGLNLVAPLMQNTAPYGLPGRANIYEQGGNLGNYFDRYFDKAYTTKIVDAKDKSQQGLDVTDSPRLTTDMVEQGGYDMANDYLGLFSDPSSP